MSESVPKGPKSNPWLRLYAEVLHDPKVQSLPADVFRTWVNLLCACSRNDDWTTPSEDALAWLIRVPQKKLRAILSELNSIGLMERLQDGRYRPLGWEAMRPYSARLPWDEWKEIRQEVFERDGFKCVYCGDDEMSALECDHVVPIRLGGANDTSNLATSCRGCNRSKGSKAIGEWVQ